MIKPDAYLHLGKIISMVEQTGFIISNLKIAKMTSQNAEEFYAEHRVGSFNVKSRENPSTRTWLAL